MADSGTTVNEMAIVSAPKKIAKKLDYKLSVEFINEPEWYDFLENCNQ